VGFLVLGSFFSEMCTGNSKDTAGFGELVKILCDQTVLSIIIACYILGRKILELIALQHYVLNILWKKITALPLVVQNFNSTCSHSL